MTQKSFSLGPGKDLAYLLLIYDCLSKGIYVLFVSKFFGNLRNTILAILIVFQLTTDNKAMPCYNFPIFVREIQVI